MILQKNAGILQKGENVVGENKMTYTQNMFIKSISAQRYDSTEGHTFDLEKNKESFSFVYVIKGEVSFRTVNSKIDGGAGDLFYIPHGIRYRSFWSGADGTEHYAIHVYPNKFTDPYALQRVGDIFNLDIQKEIVGIYDAFACGENGFADGMARFFSFYAKVLPTLKQGSHERLSELIVKATKYMEEHSAEPFSVAALARKHLVSESTLYHTFRRELGTTPNQYYNLVRLERVIDEMDSGESLESIAYRCGFESYGYFRELFKKHIGMTPKNYQALCMQKKK